MADLVSNLQSIYNTKLQIKSAIGTDSDVFSDYPAYISAMVDSGYTYVTTNGDHSVNGYAYVNVNVPGATEYDHIEISANSQVNVAAYNYAYVSVPVPPGYIVPEGTINIDTVGTHDVTAYANADFSVPAGYIVPEGTINIDTVGTHDVTAYANADFSVPAGYIVPEGTINIDTVGTHDVTAYANAYVDITIPTYVFGYQDITSNGTTYASTYGLDGFTYVTVNVPTGSSIHDGLTPYTAFTVDELISYMNENYNPGDPQTADALYVKGKIANVIYTFSAQYPSWRGYLTNDGNFYYETENPSNYDLSKDLYVYGCFWESTQSQLWDSLVTPQVAVGDEVIILAPVAINNNGRVGTQNGYLYSHQKPVTGQLTVSQSGTYDVQNYVSAYVDVQGGGAPTMSVSGQYGVYDGKYFVYDTNNYTYLTFNGPLANMNLGDTVSGTAEYADFDGLGNSSTYLFKNFSGTSVQDPNRVYTNFTVGSYYGNSQTIIYTISGSVTSQSTELYSEGMMATYSLPSNYSGPVIEAGSTVYCYVSTTNAMAMTQNLINEVVTVFAPTLTGMSYSTDNGMTWNSMNYDSLTASYSVSGLSKTVSSGSSDNSIYMRQEFDNSSYKYVSPYIEFNSGSSSPIQMTVSPNTMMSGIQLYNMSGNTQEITGLEYSINSNYISVSFQPVVEYAYRIVETDSTGVPTGNKYAMQYDSASTRWYYNNYNGESMDYFYIEKFIVGQGTGVEDYKVASDSTMTESTYYTVNTGNTGLLHLTDDTKNKIYFSLSNMYVWYMNEAYMTLVDGWNNVLCKVYDMSVGGSTYSPATTKSGLVFKDPLTDYMWRTPAAETINNGYDGSLTLDLDSTSTLTFEVGGNYNMYYWVNANNTRGVFIHDTATV
ncbi:MAG: hypothetical protein K5656_03345 [Lachnospiraceae bacterium]|nr:hypothetical protein [Lachnospiraceae bacterium]